MPWKAHAMAEIRFAACHAVRTLHRPVAAVARDFAVSRKTLYKWLRRFDAQPDPTPALLADHSRKPHASPRQTPPAAEQAILAVRDQYRWGPRKIHAFLQQEAHRQHTDPPVLPTVRTLARILRRHGRINPPPPPTPEPQRFERPAPNQLWQIDHKGPVEIHRQKVMPLSVLDDHSRYCLAFTPCLELSHATVWTLLWAIFQQVGLPQAILADNGFRGHGNLENGRYVGLGWLDARLIRLGIDPLHGRPYHPQTQGKVERFHGTRDREFLDFNARRDSLEHFTADCEAQRQVYNTLRPHEALGDQPPLSRWQPSARVCPPQLPEIRYPAGSILRKVSTVGDIRYQGYRILCGRGLTGQEVRIEEREQELAVFYANHQLRTLPLLSREQRQPDKML